MPKVAVYNVEGDNVGELELSDTIFGQAVNQTVMHEVVVMQLANRRRGTHQTKTRSDVRGGGRKPWRQKGTGRARHGTIRSPIWRGGGIVFGPHPRDYSYSVPKKVRRLALKSALSAKLEAGQILVLDELRIDEPKTREMVRILNNLKAGEGALVVTADKSFGVQRSLRNIPGVKSLESAHLNVLDILDHPTLVITKDAVAQVEEVLSR
ncbi:MAG: 50S ribosomal protein L4 [Eubacteriales bacterium]|jgi:large subunit ribosomal protein L4|nr:50S ribosomal protein L4 [Bacillota bacterium]MBV1728194.1 50S ribosomal protein L4 [Desulforudis sp.]MDP3051723.1 50S ribosomal protein L4 [Eubacteriales bacterium]MDQ7790194.1 50S ribosomal protein L4 [Clostridia bacterium]MBU4533913.1 50S ribosomal protein L4 [Bacillota bacterium]